MSSTPVRPKAPPSAFIHARSNGGTSGSPRVIRTWRTRKDPFAPVWARVLGLLNANPDVTAKEVFQLLRDENPGIYSSGQLRTLQRRVRAWRRERAAALLQISIGRACECVGDQDVGTASETSTLPAPRGRKGQEPWGARGAG